MSKRRSQFVVPGERLGVIEEFLPGQGTYVDNGVIYSTKTGYALSNFLNKTVSVYPRVRPPPVPRDGSIILGQVTSVQDKLAVIRISKIGKKSISGFFTGLLHISNVSADYVKTMFDAFKTGDVVRAKVISTVNRTFHLSTADKKLGVVYALCSHCGHTLILKGKELNCPSCKKIEKRTTAADYGKGVL